MAIGTRITCRVCDGSLDPIFSLGEQYVSDFPAPQQPDGAKAPLDVVLCQNCKLLQLRHTVSGEFYRQYWYRSGTNQTMRGALADIAASAESLVHLQPGDTVLDIGCNDGTLLDSYKMNGIYKVGIDPAENLAVLSSKVADRVLVAFFESQIFDRDPDLKGRRPKIVTSIAMFYDLEDPNKFVADIRKVMHPDGLWVIQMSYLPSMLQQNDFANICHEHLEYYSLQSLEYLLNRHGLVVVDVQQNDVNGGSFRIYVRHREAAAGSFGEDSYREQSAGRLSMLRDFEKELGLDTINPYQDFAERVAQIKRRVSAFVREQVVQENKKVFVYGASTKGNAMLQYFDLDYRLIVAAAERNPEKWGKVTVGTRIPIVSEEEARKTKPDFFLVLPWHFLNEFREREKEFLLGGGKFIVPLPHFDLI